MVSKSETTGVTFTWEQQAINGEPLPDGLGYAEKVLYIGLRSLYFQVRNKFIPRETAIIEKKKLLEDFRLNKFNEEMFEEDSKIWAKISGPVIEYTNEPSIEKADKILELLYGVKRKGGIRNEPM